MLPVAVLPKSRFPATVLISVNNRDKEEVVDVAADFERYGFKILASRGTAKLLKDSGISAECVNKLQEGRPNMMDLLMNGQVDLVINTPSGQESKEDDSYLRKTAIKKKIPYMTTIAAAKATISGIKSVRKHGNSPVKSLQELHSEIKDK